MNTYGGYKCKCPPGYKVSPQDFRLCVPGKVRIWETITRFSFKKHHVVCYRFITVTSLIHKVIPLKLFLNIVPSSSPDNVTTLVARMFSWMLLSLLRLQNMRHRVGYFQTALRFQNRRRRKSHLTNKTFMENQLFLFSSNLIKVVL